MLSQQEESHLNQMLKTFQDSTSNQIAVLTLTDFDDRTEGPLFDFSKKVFTTWGIGDKTKNNGVLFVVVKNLASKNGIGLRLMPGYGLEGALPDVTCRKINESVRSLLSNGEYFKGINSAVGQIMDKTQKEFNSEVSKKGESLPLLVIIFFILLGLAIVLFLVELLDSFGKSSSNSSSSGFSAGFFIGSSSSDSYSSGGDSGGDFGGFGGGDCGGGGAGD